MDGYRPRQCSRRSLSRVHYRQHPILHGVQYPHPIRASGKMSTPGSLQRSKSGLARSKLISWLLLNTRPSLQCVCSAPDGKMFLGKRGLFLWLWGSMFIRTKTSNSSSWNTKPVSRFFMSQLPDQWEEVLMTVMRPGPIRADSRCVNTVPDDDNQMTSLQPGSRSALL